MNVPSKKTGGQYRAGCGASLKSPIGLGYAKTTNPYKPTWVPKKQVYRNCNIKNNRFN